MLKSFLLGIAVLAGYMLLMLGVDKLIWYVAYLSFFGFLGGYVFAKSPNYWLRSFLFYMPFGFLSLGTIIISSHEYSYLSYPISFLFSILFGIGLSNLPIRQYASMSIFFAYVIVAAFTFNSLSMLVFKWQRASEMPISKSAKTNVLH